MCDATSTQVKTQNKGCVLYKLQYVPVSYNTTACNLYTNRHTVDYCMYLCMVFLADACFHYSVPKTKTQDIGPIHYSSQCALYSKKEHNKEVMMMRWNIVILYLRVHVRQTICFWRNSQRSPESYCTVDCMWISCIHTLEGWCSPFQPTSQSFIMTQPNIKILTHWGVSGDWNGKIWKGFVTHVDKNKKWHRQDLNLRQRRPEPKSGALDHSATMSCHRHT